MNEIEFKLITENANDLIRVYNENFELLYINELIHIKLLGYSKEDLVGKSREKLRHPEEYKEIGLYVRNLVKTGESLREGRMRHKDGHWIWFEIKAKKYINQKGETRFVTFSREITERKEVELKLRESEEKYHHLFETAPYAIVLANTHGIIYDCNLTTEKIFGYSKEYLIGKNHLETPFYPPEELPLLKKRLNIRSKGEATESIEIKVFKKDGRLAWIIPLISLVELSNETYIQAILLDITPIKESELKVKESEEKYKLMTENANDLITVLSDDYKIEYINEKAFQKELGYTKNDIIGKSAVELIHPKDISVAINALDKGFEVGGARAELRVKNKNGVYKWFENSGNIFLDKTGNKKALLISRDITDRKKIQEELKESEEKYRFITENINDIVSVFNEKFELEYINDTQKNISGYTREELIGKSTINFLHSDDIKRALDIFKQTLKEGEGRGQFRLHSKDGTYKWLDSNSRLTYDPKGQKKILIVSRDITKEKDIERKLKESEEKYRFITENANDLISVLNEKFKVEFINEQAYLNILGYSIEDMIGKSALDFAHPDDIERAIKDLRQGFKIGFAMDELRIRHKNGKYIWFEIKGNLFKDSDGRTKAILVSRDISDRKIFEIKLKESEERYRLINENVNDLVVIFNENFQFEYINEHVFLETLGYSNEDLLGKTMIDLIHPEDLKQATLATSRILRKGTGSNEFRLKGKNGHYIWLEAKGKRFLDNEGNHKILTVLRDTTVRKLAVQKLRESEMQHRLIIENSYDVIFTLDMNLKPTYFSDSTFTMLGYTGEEKVTLPFSKCYTRKSRRTLTKIYREELIKEGKKDKDLNRTKKFELEQIHKNGSIVYTEDIITFMRNDKGTAVGILGVSRDITERRLAEDKLKESEEKFRNIAEQSLMGIAILQDDVLKYVNQQYANIYRYSVEEMKNWPPGGSMKTIHNDYKDFVREQARKKQLGLADVINRYQHLGIRKDGEPIWVENFSKTISYGGKPADLIGIIDITEKKEAEQKLKEISKLKSELLRRTSHELKTPLISIKGFAELLLALHRDKFDSETISIIKEITHGCERLENLIAIILKSSELDSGQVKLKTSMEDLTFLINFCVQELKMLLKMREQNIKLEIHEDMITQFEKERMYEVVSNLITNAIKYSPPKSEIRIKSKIMNSSIIISISDTGIGFTDDEKEKIFKQFGKIERYGQGWDVGIGGNGLGLYISKKIVELHGGSIWMESEGRNKGSTFYFSLPIINK